MAPLTIDVDGHLDLVKNGGIPGTEVLDAEQTKLSRLNDIMIVLECEHSDLEARLLQRAQASAPEVQFTALRLTLDERAPKFHVALDVAESFEPPLGQEHRRSLETDVASEILAVVERRVSSSAQRRWQPRVIATYRMPEKTAPAGNGRRGIWLKVLLLLVAILAGGTGYLVLRTLTG